MFDKKTVDAYKSIKAPETLRQRIYSINAVQNEQSEKSNRNVISFFQKTVNGNNFKRMGAVAAMLIAVIALSFYVSALSNSALYVQDNKIGASEPIFLENRVKAFSTENAAPPVLIEIKSLRQTNISVDTGMLRITDTNNVEYTAKNIMYTKGQQIYWDTQMKTTDQTALMYVKTGNKTIIYSMYFDEIHQTWAIKQTDQDK